MDLVLNILYCVDKGFRLFCNFGYNNLNFLNGLVVILGFLNQFCKLCLDVILQEENNLIETIFDM